MVAHVATANAPRARSILRAFRGPSVIFGSSFRLDCPSRCLLSVTPARNSTSKSPWRARTISTRPRCKPSPGFHALFVDRPCPPLRERCKYLALARSQARKCSCGTSSVVLSYPATSECQNSQFVQARNPGWMRQVFFAQFDAEATWLDQLRPAFGQKKFFYEDELEKISSVPNASSGQLYQDGGPISI